MSTAQLKELLDDRTIVMPLSVEQYHRMIETGTLTSGEPIELLDGFLVRKDRSAAGADAMSKCSRFIAGKHPGGGTFELPVESFLP